MEEAPEVVESWCGHPARPQPRGWDRRGTGPGTRENAGAEVPGRCEVYALTTRAPVRAGRYRAPQSWGKPGAGVGGAGRRPVSSAQQQTGALWASFLKSFALRHYSESRYKLRF